jgi:hypothetical protein
VQKEGPGPAWEVGDQKRSCEKWRRDRCASGGVSWQCAADARKEAACSKIERWHSTALLSGNTPVEFREAETSCTEGELKLHAHERVDEAHGGSSGGVGRKMAKSALATWVWSLAMGPRPGKDEPRDRSVAGDIGESRRG